MVQFPSSAGDASAAGTALAPVALEAWFPGEVRSVRLQTQAATRAATITTAISPIRIRRIEAPQREESRRDAGTTSMRTKFAAPAGSKDWNFYRCRWRKHCP